MTSFFYRLAAVDIDDTLVGQDKCISEPNRKAVQALRKLNCEVILASGRRHQNMLSFCTALGLSDYVVSCGGAVARHARTGEVVHQATLPVLDAAEVTAQGLDRGLTVLFWSADGVFARQRTRWVERYTTDCGGDPVGLVDVQAMADGGTPAEKVVWGAEPEVIASVFEELRPRLGDRVQLTVTDDFFLEFASPRANKAVGVAAVAARRGVARHEVLAFGDGNNDVELLSWAGTGVAMRHGRPAAHRAADRLSPPGDPQTAFARSVAAILDEANLLETDSSLGRLLRAA